MSELDKHSQSTEKYNESFSFKENKSYLKISFERQQRIGSLKSLEEAVK